jgi:hypothetical protein
MRFNDFFRSVAAVARSAAALAADIVHKRRMGRLGLIPVTEYPPVTIVDLASRGSFSEPAPPPLPRSRLFQTNATRIAADFTERLRWFEKTQPEKIENVVALTVRPPLSLEDESGNPLLTEEGLVPVDYYGRAHRVMSDVVQRGSAELERRGLFTPHILVRHPRILQSGAVIDLHFHITGSIDPDPKKVRDRVEYLDRTFGKGRWWMSDIRELSAFLPTAAYPVWRLAKFDFSVFSDENLKIFSNVSKGLRFVEALSHFRFSQEKKNEPGSDELQPNNFEGGAADLSEDLSDLETGLVEKSETLSVVDPSHDPAAPQPLADESLQGKTDDFRESGRLDHASEMSDDERENQMVFLGVRRVWCGQTSRWAAFFENYSGSFADAERQFDLRYFIAKADRHAAMATRFLLDTRPIPEVDPWDEVDPWEEQTAEIVNAGKADDPATKPKGASTGAKPDAGNEAGASTKPKAAGHAKDASTGAKPDAGNEAGASTKPKAAGHAKDASTGAKPDAGNEAGASTKPKAAGHAKDASTTVKPDADNSDGASRPNPATLAPEKSAELTGAASSKRMSSHEGPEDFTLELTVRSEGGPAAVTAKLTLPGNLLRSIKFSGNGSAHTLKESDVHR